MLYVIYIFISSPFLFVCGNDRVTRYTGADDDTGDVEDAQATEWGLAGIKARDFFVMFSFMILDFENCKALILQF